MSDAEAIAPVVPRRPARQRPGRAQLREEREFYLFIAPWLVGFLIWTAGPMLYSLYISFTTWDVFTKPVWVGLQNYQTLWNDLFNPSQLVLFSQSLKVTTIYTLLMVPLRMIVNLLGAMLLNQKIRGMPFFRAVFYSPTVIPAVASAMAWMWIMQSNGGLVSLILNKLGLPNQTWLFRSNTALPTLVGLGLWGFGSQMLYFLAGLQSIPEHLYEAAKIDGAGQWHQFRYITVPMLSPVIFYNLVTSMMGTFQAFDVAFLYTGGGPNYSTWFYVLNIYTFGWRYFKFGLASAMAWVLLLIIMVMTLLVLRSSNAWVYYEGEVKGR
ncbi:MAG: sugar ABC transporter permease [Chloroflexi bacterium]|nr:sugar ABC transporter permease [Chloroflexota bacterium]